MKTKIRYIAFFIAVSILFSSFSILSVNAISTNTLSTMYATVDSALTEELQPNGATTCASYYYPTFHALLDAKGIGYTGNANHTELDEGYTYTYSKGCGYWAIYLEGEGVTGLYYVGSM